MNGLKNNSITPSNTTHIKNILFSLISISVDDKNKELLIDNDIIPHLIVFIRDCKESDIWKNSAILLSKICLVKSIEKKNTIIKTGIFKILHEKFLEISPPPPSIILPTN
jgi:hypothetical protein